MPSSMEAEIALLIPGRADFLLDLLLAIWNLKAIYDLCLKGRGEVASGSKWIDCQKAIKGTLDSGTFF